MIDQLDVDRATRQRKWVPRAPDTKLKWASRNEQRANNRLMDQLVHNNPLRKLKKKKEKKVVLRNRNGLAVEEDEEKKEERTVAGIPEAYIPPVLW